MKDGNCSHKLRISYEDIANYDLKEGDVLYIDVVKIVRVVNEDDE